LGLISKNSWRILIVLLLGSSTVCGQNNIKENVYLHLSSDDLLVGETLYFSSYTYSEANGKLSGLSSILYVEILDQKGEQVYRTKLLQKNGLGNGAYFIPSELETGRYHIVAYTRWMQNFDAFFRQTITIINPYKSFHPTDAEVKKTETIFFVEGGQLIANKENKIVIQSLDQNRRGSVIKGRIVNESGSLITEVNTDTFGYFSFNFTPLPNEQYKLIIENKSGFEFIELPEICDQCVSIQVKKEYETHEISIQSNINGGGQAGKVELFHGSTSIKHFPQAVNSSLLIKNATLPNGLIKAVYTLDGKTKSERLFWNGKLETVIDQKTEVYNSLEEVNASFHIADKATVSIAVGMVPLENNALSWSVAHEVNSAIKSPIPPLFYSSITANKLDVFLITAKLKEPTPHLDSVNYLPEYRYGIVQGKLTNKQEGTPLKNIKMGIGFISDTYPLSVATTAANGDFVLRYTPELIHEKGFVHVIDELPMEYEMILHNEYYTKFRTFPIQPIRFDSLRIAQVIKRSINNQIENAYYIPDNIDSTHQSIYQLSDVRTYTLDDYTRFATMRDTFIELIFEVGVSKNENKHHFKMKTVETNSRKNKNAATLVLLDGVAISTENALKLSPYLIDRIDVLNRKYYLGNTMFDGIISFHTTKNDLANVTPLGKEIEIVNVQKNNKERIVSIHPTKDTRIPHYESLLYWNPTVNHKGGNLDFSFYTSEVKGIFEIRIEGVTKMGLPISRRKYIEVK